MLQEADKDLFLRLTKQAVPNEAFLEKYKLYQYAKHGVQPGPLSFDAMLHLVVDAGLVSLPVRKPTEFDDLPLDTEVEYFGGGGMGWVRATFQGVEGAGDGMAFVNSYGDPGLRRQVLVRDLRLMHPQKPKPAPVEETNDEPVVEKKPEAPKVPSPWDSVKPGTPIDVAIPGENVRTGEYVKRKFGRKTGKVPVKFEGDDKAFRWIDEAHCRVARQLVGA